jgi:hypothetical protein
LPDSVPGERPLSARENKPGNFALSDMIAKRASTDGDVASEFEIRLTGV